MITKDTEKLFLLDAYALIYRAFFALNKNPRLNSKGVNTSAVIGFLNTLYELIKNERPSHLGIAFDLGAPTLRTDNFSDYKANREEMPPDLRASIPYIMQIIRAFNIPIFAVEGYEADDVIGTLAKKAEKAGFLTYMMTPDKDFGQLVTENILIYRPAKFGEDAKVLGPKEICEKYGINTPTQLIDILGLWGDASDNIPGIPGVGEKTASKFVQQYGSMEGLFEHVDELKGKMKENVVNYQEQGRLSKMLATINVNAPVDFVPDELKMKVPDVKALLELFEELEFKTFAKRFMQDYNAYQQQKTSSEGAVATAHASSPDLFSQNLEPSITPDLTLFSSKDSIKSVSHDYKIVTSQEELHSLVAALNDAPVFSINVLSEGDDILSNEIYGISLCFKEHEAYFIPPTIVSAGSFTDALNPLFSNASKTIVCHNIKSIIPLLDRHGINIRNKMFDTMIAHYLIEPEQRHSLDTLAEVYLDYLCISLEDIIGKGRTRLKIKDIDINTVSDFSSECADVSLRLYHVFTTYLNENKLDKLFEDIEMPLVPVLSAMEANGVKIDSEGLNQISESQAVEIQDIERQIFDYAGMSFNISSPKQLGEVLFEKLKIKVPAKKTKSGQYPTGEDVLQKIIGEHPVIQLVLDYRGLTKLKSTYSDALPALINPIDGLVHTSYNQAVTATGRLSSTNPNLQNIPVRTDKGKEIRKAFVPRDANHILLAADYSQIELRIIAHLSGDAVMCEAFRAGHDIHTATAARVYGVGIDEVTKDMRRKAKAVNFGIIYGMSAFGLAERIGISRTEASEVIKSYFKEYVGIQEYINNIKEFARSHGYVETMFGRRRYLHDINTSNSVVRAFAERNAVNAPIQGSSADMIKLAMSRIFNEMNALGMRSKMILQVHDELVFDAVLDEVETLKAVVKDKMVNALPLSIPVVVELNTGHNWLEAH